MVKDGENAPDFVLPRDGGETVKLGQFKGNSVVLFFYPKDDTSGCTKEATEFSARLDEFRRAGAEVVGISPDSVKSHNKFREKHGLTVMLLSDEEKTVLEAYGVWVEKSMYGRKYMGVERSTFIIGADGRIIRSWRKVKVPGHVDEVLAVLQEQQP
ncbi:MAG: thioredoxin-dependent thiol peroxidase [Hyphomicrobiales bacterium]|nr:thioredoxin-dependent thiol peroxidase [Hyphomicrobiales bacterium]